MCSVAGIGVDEADGLVVSAELSCEEDVYHFDEIERFFLVSCLALWYAYIETESYLHNIYKTPFLIRHARKKETGLAEKYATLASGIHTYNVHRYMYKNVCTVST